MNKNLGELFDIAQQYGNITLFQCSKDRTFNVRITFMTINHAELIAQSGYRHDTISKALIKAIEKAEEIVISLKETVGTKYKLLKNDSS